MSLLRNRWLRRVLFVILILGAGLALRLTVLAPDPVPVTVYRVARGNVEDTVTNSKADTVKTRRRAALTPEIGGRVARLVVHEGDHVRRDDVLLELADADYRAQVTLRERALDAAVASREEACTNARQAQRDLDRYVRLAAEQIVSEELLDQFQSRRDSAVSACDGARARALEAEAALDVARIELSRTVLRAPFDAVVAEVSTEVGEWITPAPPGIMIPPVVELIDDAAIYVSAPLDEVDVGRVRTGQPVRITLDAFTGRELDGSIARVAPYVLDLEEQNRTFEVEVEFSDAAFARTLLPGSSADVEVILDTRPDVLRVPSYALIEGSRVLVLEDDTLVSHDLEAGLKNWQFTEITAGLEGGELVVVFLDRLEVQPGARARVASGDRAMIRLAGISRVYDIGGKPVHALRDLDLDIGSGEYVSIMGPSGSGKSTLLNVIGCLDRPTSGSYRLEDREVARLDELELSRIRQRKIGFVFQSFHLVSRLDAAGNVELPMVFAGVYRAERRRRVDRALAAVGLAERADHRPDQLSGGERQRVAIARSVVMKPSIVLADEPTGNLDTAAGQEVIGLLESMNADGLTLVVVTHDPAVGGRAGLRVRLSDGRREEA